MTPFARLCLGAATALVLTLPLGAASPTRWQVSTAGDWLEGRGEHVAVDREGRITLGPTLTEVHEDTAPSIWDVVVAPDGRVFAGTGNDGRIVVLEGTSSRTFFDSDELQMHALAWHDGALLAASSPSGQVYRIAADGTALPFFNPEDGYIWALVVGPDDDVFVATGNKARVYRVGRDGGNPRVVFESAAANVTSLAVNGDHLLVGTDNPGRLYRVPFDGGRAFALLDGPHTQVQAIRPTADGGAFVLTVSPTASTSASPGTTTSSASAPTPVVTTEVSIVAIGDAATTSSATSSGSGKVSGSGASAKGKGTVYRLTPAGLADTYWDVPAELPFDIALAGDGSLLMTAEDGAVYRLDGDPVRASRLGQTASEQVTRIVRRGDGYLLAGANPGKLYALGAAPARTGTYTSKVRDAASGATWGLMQWDGDVGDPDAVAFETRSGNTSTPDDTWAEWAAVRRDGGVTRIASPPARYLQWRVTLTGGGRGTQLPVLDAVTATYLGANRRPRVSSVTVHAPGVVFQQPFGTQEPPELAGYLSTTPAPARDRALSATSTSGSSAAVGRRLYQKGFQTLQWDALDPDDDDLRYRVLLRRAGSDTWQELARDLVGTVHTWDTTQQADGRYYVRVVATDGRANPASSALEGERQVGPFTIDNAAPVITITASRRAAEASGPIRLTVSDGQSPLVRVDVLQAEGGWMPLFPDDGVLDGHVETFVIDRTKLGSGVIVVRAADTLANISTLEIAATAATSSR